MNEKVEIRADASDFPSFLEEKYSCESCLKWNGTESTWLCRDRASGNPVLIKVAEDRTAVRCLRNEYEVLQVIAGASDPAARLFSNSIALIEPESEPGRVAFVRSWLPGRTLESIVESQVSRPGLPRDLAVRFLTDVLDQLDFLHHLHPPVIHRDIKPQNVIVDEEDRCHLIDLGVSRTNRGPSDSDTLIMGTRLTSPPEQYGFRSTDARSDIYSAGVLLRYCLTGTYGESADASLPPDLRSIVQKATQFDPNNRYPRVSDFREALRAVQKPDASHGERRGLSGWLCALLFILLFAAGFLLGRFTAPDSKAPAETAPQVPAVSDPAPASGHERSEKGQSTPAAVSAEADSSGDASEDTTVSGVSSSGKDSAAAMTSEAAPSTQNSTDAAVPAWAKPDYGITEEMFGGDTELFAGYAQERFLDCSVAIQPDGLHMIRYLDYTDALPIGQAKDRTPLSGEELAAYLSALQHSPLWRNGFNLLIVDRNIETLEPFRIKYLSDRICVEFHNCSLPADPSPLSAIMPYCFELAAYNCAPVAWDSLDFLRTANYVNLLDLTFDGTVPVDLSALAVLQSPHFLRLTNATIDRETMEVIGRMTELEVLCLANCGITDVTPLQNLTNLQELNLNLNLITDLSPVENLPALKSFSAAQNPATRGQ